MPFDEEGKFTFSHPEGTRKQDEPEKPAVVKKPAPKKAAAKPKVEKKVEEPVVVDVEPEVPAVDEVVEEVPAEFYDRTQRYGPPKTEADFYKSG
jgi:hypothetical protein